MEEKLELMARDENCDASVRQELMEDFTKRLQGLKKRAVDRPKDDTVTEESPITDAELQSQQLQQHQTPQDKQQQQNQQQSQTAALLSHIPVTNVTLPSTLAMPLPNLVPTPATSDDSPTTPSVAPNAVTAANPYTQDAGLGSRPIFCSLSEAGLRWIETQTCDPGFQKRHEHVTIPTLERQYDFLCHWRTPELPPAPIFVNEDVLRFLARTFLEAANPYLGIVDDADVLRIFNSVICDATNPPGSTLYPSLSYGETLLFHGCVLVSLEIFLDVTRNKNAGELAETILPMEKALGIRDQTYANAQRDYMVLINAGGTGSGLENQLALQACLMLLTSTLASTEPQLVEPLVTTCMRYCYQMRLHREETTPHNRTLRNCFWATYMYEASCLGRICRRPLIRDYDITLTCPESDALSWRAPYVRLCRLQGRVCDELYMVPPDQRDPTEILHIASVLDRELQNWRASVPHDLDFEAEYDAVHPVVLEAFAPLHGIHIRPVNIMGLINERCCNAYRFRARNLGLTLLNCMYQHVTILIHKMFFWYPRWALPVNLSFAKPTFSESAPCIFEELHDQDLHSLPQVSLPSKRVFASNSLVRSSARKICNALTRMDLRYTSFMWIFAFFPSIAFDVLLQTVILTPGDTTLAADLSRMKSCIGFLKKLEGSSVLCSERFFVPVFEELLAYATGFANNATSETFTTTNHDSVIRPIPDAVIEVSQASFDSFTYIEATAPVEYWSGVHMSHPVEPYMLEDKQMTRKVA